MKVWLDETNRLCGTTHVHQSTSLNEWQKALEAHDHKFWVTNLSLIPHTLGILTANIFLAV